MNTSDLAKKIAAATNSTEAQGLQLHTRQSRHQQMTHQHCGWS